ncbi:hypothetical protein DPEC_G00181100 [Dallia pectoralis]|uniref:Uncharacterized protein n=1 Tax=Dallia pectoralis TaxID=75939 RepID=A0ACC2GAM6_DALPE|nr:hypothetical protein DPEC_G00181100 [Dallia pectoralis]
MGFISGVPGGYLLSSTLAAGTGDLGPRPEDVNKEVSESDRGLVMVLTLWIGMLVMLFLPLAVGGVLCWAVSRRIRRAGETEPDAMEVVAVLTVVLLSTSGICGGLGLLSEMAVGSLTRILELYGTTVGLSLKIQFLVVSPFVAASSAGVAVQFGRGVVKLRVATGIGTGILAALRSQSLLGDWGTMGALLGPAAAAGVALSAAQRRSSTVYGRPGRVGTILGAMCAAWYWRGSQGILTVLVLAWIFTISLVV